MNNQELAKKLISSGMSQAEAQVYVVLLAQPSMIIQEVVKAVGLPRSTVVLALDKLTRTGVVEQYTYGKRRSFVIRSVEAIERYIVEEERKVEARRANLGQLIGSLRQSHFLAASKGIEVEILKGEEDYKKLYLRTLELKPGEEILRINVASEKFIFFRDFFREYSQQKNKQKIKTRLLLPDTVQSREVRERDKKHVRETRFLSKKIYNPDAAIVIWGNNVAFTVWDENLETIVIKTQELVDILRSLFEILWQSSKK